MKTISYWLPRVCATSRRLAVTTLAVLATVLLLPAGAAAQPVPGVTLNVPGQVPIGEQISFSVSLSNTSGTPTDVGYGPFVDLVLPVNGADGAAGTDIPDGISFASATYLGSPVTTVELSFPDDDGAGPGTTGCVDHPYATDITHTPLQVCGTAGDALVVIQLPFGSLVTTQPPITITVGASLSALADLGTPLTIRARGGFQYGANPLDDPCCDPTILTPPAIDSSTWPVVATTTPTLISLTKTYSGPENETATGPSFPRRYTIAVDVAAGQTVTNLDVTDLLPTNMAFLSVISTTPAAIVSATPPVGVAAAPPANELTATFVSITGTAATDDATITFEYFIPIDDATASPVLNPGTGDDATAENNASALGDWVPVDPRDTGGTDTASAGTPGPEHTLTPKSIATQKGVAVAVDQGAAGPSPGDVLEYTVAIQISDFFAFEDLVVTDVLSDGQHIDGSFTPTMSVTEHGATSSGTLNASSFTVAPNYTPADPAPNDGTTTLSFRISDELVLRSLDGILPGGCVPAGGTGGPVPDCSVFNGGGTVATLVFRSVIQEEFSDTFPSGDQSVDQGDGLDNTVEVLGQLLDVADLSALGTDETDGSGAGVTIAFGTLDKSIYAVNGSTSFPMPIEVSPGDTITFRLEYTLPSSDFENLTLVDYLPLPVFDATEITAFVDPSPATVPPAGTAWYEAADTFYALGGFHPAISTDTSANSLTFTYGTFDDPTSTPSKIDILFTLTVSNDPFADGLFLTNQVRASEGTTNAGNQTLDDVVRITLREPYLAVTKGAIGTDNPAGVFDPVTTGPVPFDTPPDPVPPPFTPPVGSGDLAGAPIDSDLGEVDAGDILSFAITIENTGGSGAFDIVVHDTIPPGFAVPSTPGGLNLSIVRGDGFIPAWTPLGPGGTDADLFGNGIELDDSGGQPVCQKAHPTDGSNVLLVTYELEVVNAEAVPAVILSNTGGVTQYSGDDGSGTTDNHVEDPQVFDDSTEITVASPSILKGIVPGSSSEPSTTLPEVAVGETFQHSVVIRLPEGVSPTAALVDTVDSGLLIDAIASITPSSGDVTTDIAGGFAGVLGAAVYDLGGRRATLDLGTVTNANTDNATDETLTVVFNVRVDAATATAGDSLANTAVWTWSLGSISASAPPVSVVEPDLGITKVASPSTGDAGDTVTFTVNVQHTGTSTADAFDLAITDALPAGMTWAGNVIAVTGPAPAVDTSGLPTVVFTWPDLAQAAGPLSFSFDITLDTSVRPTEVLTNTASLVWDSLPGEIGEREYGPVTDSDTVTINTVTLAKSLIDTSESHTSGSSVAVGEIVRYRLQVALPEGTSPNLQLRDLLPGELQLLDDGTARVAFVASTAMTSTGTLALDPVAIGCDGVGANPSLLLIGNETTVGTLVPECPLPDLNLTNDIDLIDEPGDDTYTSSTDGYVKLGDVVNADSDADIEYVVVELNALVLNIATDTAGINRDNRFRVYLDGTSLATSGTVRTTTVEPSITDLVKTVVPTTGDAGDTVAFTVTYSNATGATASTAFEARLVDTLPGFLTLAPASVALTLGGGANGITNVSAGNTVDVTIAEVPAGGTVQIDYTATINPTAPPGQVITNTALLEYTSLPGATGTTPNPTGSTTPGASGTDTGERDGSDGVGGTDDYVDSDTATVTIDSPGLVKVVQATSEPTTGSAQHTAGLDDLTIGETATFRITATIPEGTTPLVVLTDTLPYTAGLMRVVSSTVVSIGANLTPSTGPGVGGACVHTDTQLADGIQDTITCDFGQVSNASDQVVTAADQIVIDVVAVLVDEAANQDADLLTNSVLLQFGPGLNQSDTAEVEVVEPVLLVDKTGSVGSGDAGDTITFTLQVEHAPGTTADAFDVVLTDVIPAGMTYVGGSLTDTGAVPATTLGEAAGTITATWDTLAIGDVGQIQLQVTLDTTVVPGTTITNTADLVWDTLPADGDPDERTSTDSDTHQVLITGPGAVKTVFATSEPSTGTAINGPEDDLTIGEQVTYHFTFTLSEGTTPAAVIRDQLPTGTSILEVVSSQVLRVGANISGPGVPAVGTAGTASDSNADTFDDRVEWSLGDVLNSPDGLNTADDELELEVVAVVIDQPLNQGGLDDQVNTATLSFSGGSVSATAVVDIVEPRLSITKTVTSPAAGFVDAGDTVDIELLISHLPASTADAFTLEVVDLLPDPGLSWIGDGTVATTCPGGVTTDSSADPTISFSIAGLTQATGSCTITYSAIVDVAVNPGVTYTNLATLQWDSQPVYTGGETRRQTDSDTADVTVLAPVLVKVASSTSLADTGLPYYNVADFDLAIGETVTYTLTVAFPEGTTDTAVITDLMPGNATGVIEAIGANIVSIGAQLSTSLPGTPVLTDTLLGDGLDDTITFDLGTVVNAPDGVADAGDRLVLDVVGRVVDVPANADGDSLQNLGRLTYSTGGPLDDTADIDVVEPVHVITKTLGPVIDGVVTTTLQLTNTGTAPAYDIEIQDVLADSTWNLATIAPAVIPAGFTFSTVAGPGPGEATVLITSDTGSSPPTSSVEPGEAVAFSFIATLADPANPPASVVNTATNTITTTLPGTDPEERDEPDVSDTDTLDLPVLDLLKSAALAPGGDLDGSGTVSAGDVLRYTLVLNNTGPAAATGIVIDDTPDANAVLVNGSVTTSAGGVVLLGNTGGDSAVQASFASVAAGTSATVTYDVSIPAVLPDGVTQLVNQATVASTEIPDLPSDDPSTPPVDDPTVVPLDAAPDLQITKDDGGATTVPGGTVAYTLSYANVGNQNATGVTLSDTVPANTTFNAGASSPGWACVPDATPGSVCTLTIGALAGGGASGSVVFAVTVDDPLAAGVTQVANTATVTDDGSNGADPTPGDNTGSDTTPITGQPDLQITKDDGGATTVPGGTVAYSLSFANVGNQAATGVQLTDTVPANTSFNAGASTPGWACVPDASAGSVCTLTIGALAGGGASGSATFAVTVDDPIPAGVTQIANSVTISDDGTNGPDPTPGDTTDSDTTPVDATPDLQITKDDGGATAVPGGTVAYTLTSTNVGNQDATGVELSDTVPADTTFNAGASTPGWACVPDTNPGAVCTLSLGSLAGGGGTGSATFALTVDTPIPAGVTQVANTATVADDGTNGSDPTPGDNTDSDTTPVDATPDLQITKDDGGISANAGDTVAYTLTSTNVGDQDATGVELTDTVPANTTFNAGASTAGWACVPDTNPGAVCTLSVGALAGGGGTGTATFALDIDDPLPSGVTQVANTATVADDGTNGSDPTPGDNTDSDTTPVGAVPNLTITKDDGNATTTPGGTVAYTLSYANIGTQEATGVELSDTVPANTTFNPGSSTAGWACVPDTSAGSVCTLAIGTLAGGGASGSATFAVDVDAPLAAGITQVANTVTIADDGSNGPDADPTDNTDSDTTPVTATPDLQVTKDDGGITAEPGDTVTYTLIVTNVGDQDATGVELNDTVPADTTFNAAASTAGWVCVPDTSAGSACTLAIGALAGSGGSATASFAVDIDTPFPLGVTEVLNTVTATDDGTNGSDPTPGDNDDDDTTPITTNPALDATKVDALTNDADTSGDVSAGDTLTYTVLITNVGDVEVVNVRFDDAPDANTDLVIGSVTTSQGTVSSGNTAGQTTVGIDAGNLLVGDTITITFDVTLADPLPAAVTMISNQGVASSDRVPGEPTDDPDTIQDDDPTDTPIGTVPVIDATKADALVIDADSSGTVSDGDTLEYTVIIINSGGADATNVVFTDTPGIGSSLVVGSVSTVPYGTVDLGNTAGDTTVQVTLGTMAPGDVVTVLFRVQLDNPMPAGQTVLSNQGLVTSDDTPGGEPTDDPDTGDDDDPTDTPIGGTPTIEATKIDTLQIDVDGNGVLSPGDTLRYIVQIANSGTAAATGVDFSDTPGTYTTLVTGSVTTSLGSVTSGNGGEPDVGVDIGILNPGVAVNITFDVLIDSPLPAGVTQVANQGLVTSDQGDEPTDDPDTTPDDDPTDTPMGGGPDLAITKDDGQLVVVPPVDSTYTLTIDNLGPRGATGVSVTDWLPAGTVFASASDGGTETAPGSGIVTWPPFDLAAGAQVVRTVTIHIPAQPLGAATTIFNQAHVEDDGSNGEDPDDTNNDDDDPTDLTLEPVLDVLKRVSPPASQVGYMPSDLIRWTIDVTNIGNVGIDTTALTDIIPDLTTYLPGSITLDGVVLTDALDADAGDYSSIDDRIAVTLDPIPAGATTTVTFDVMITTPPSGGPWTIANQAQVDDGTDVTDSDDPDTTDDDDPTEIEVNQVGIPVLGPVSRWLLIVLLGAAGWLALRRRSA